MAHNRHATPIASQGSSKLKALSKRLSKLGLTRIQTAVLTLGACSLALGLGNSIQSTPSASDNTTAHEPSAFISASHEIIHTDTNIDSDHDSETSDRKVISLILPNSLALDSATAIDAATDNAAPISTDPTNTTKPTQAVALIATAKQNSSQQVNDAQEDTVVAAKPAPKAKHLKQTIKKGDNLSMVFARVGLSGKDVYQVVQSGKEGKALTRMFPGEQLEFVVNDQGALQQVMRVKSPLESVYFIRNNSTDSAQYDTKLVNRTPEIKTVHRSAYVNNSLSLSAQQADVSQSITMNMANIFGGVIDFVLDVRNGDQFTVIYEERYIDGKKIDEGNIIAAQYINRDRVYNAYRYTDPDGDTGYYNEDGVSMRKAFLRAPLDFTRISSGFNMRRLHPVTKQVKPHRGIDYAAPRGTPVFSVGVGRVIASGKNRNNGNYVFVQHGESYVTKYLHLHKRNVKKGQRVKQGQIIGQVGCTGLCTGPHLHYEFLVSGVHRNPRTIMKKLPKAKRLKASLISDFLASIGSTQLQLANISNTTKLASNQ